jgi:outer membrane immunogenic protein
LKKFALSTAAFSLLAFPAMAADLSPVPYTKAPALAPVSAPGWTGFYIGGTLGGDWSDNSVNTVTTNTFVNTGALSPLGRTAGPASALASTANLGTRSTSFIGGVEAGYNWQFAPAWVAGLEADIEGLANDGVSARITQVVPRTGFPGNNYTATVSVSDKLNYLGTVRGRLGYLITPTWLLYGTGGLAYGGASSSARIAGAETPNTGTNDIAGVGSASRTLVGWTAGAGVEWLFAPNWTAKAEYLHYDLGSFTYGNGTMNGILTRTNTVAFTDISSSTAKFRGDIVRAGVNYQF